MTWIYVNANRNFLVAGVIPHAVNNLMGFSNAFNDAKIQAFVMMSIVAVIIIASGPGLRGWRSARPTSADLTDEGLLSYASTDASKLRSF
jgi:hypothetical protein